ncbi:hypothetical protein [Lactococcus formosensis]|uniref:hypothetical protein n=1 Tax=Lactococcus formosensis TaxID=1281486 RepID=UPI002550EB49|nr:hypothetical protein [Lactococcus formosensis]
MTEKESLLVLNQEIKSDLSFCRDCAVSQGATGWVKDFDRLLDKNEILNNKLNQQFSSHSKLSIPKKIADMLDQEIVADDITKFAMFHEGFERLWLSDDLTNYCVDYKNYALASAYLAGKALSVGLVEVTDD